MSLRFVTSKWHFTTWLKKYMWTKPISNKRGQTPNVRGTTGCHGTVFYPSHNRSTCGPFSDETNPSRHLPKTRGTYPSTFDTLMSWPEHPSSQYPVRRILFPFPGQGWSTRRLTGVTSLSESRLILHVWNTDVLGRLDSGTPPNQFYLSGQSPHGTRSDRYCTSFSVDNRDSIVVTLHPGVTFT